MPAPLIVVTGTGTGIGKTHASEALLRRWGRTARVCGVKPLETGVPPGEEGDDIRRLREASTFHVTPPFGATFPEPVSPHLAARAKGVAISIAEIAENVGSLRARPDGVLIELAGGLFSPLAHRVTNVDLARALLPARVLLVAPDRLGVLHDIGAATGAARAAGVRIDGIVLMAVAEPDASSGRNAAEIPLVTDIPLLAELPRATPRALADLQDVADALAALTR